MWLADGDSLMCYIVRMSSLLRCPNYFLYWDIGLLCKEQIAEMNKTRYLHQTWDISESTIYTLIVTPSCLNQLTFNLFGIVVDLELIWVDIED